MKTNSAMKRIISSFLSAFTVVALFISPLALGVGAEVNPALTESKIIGGSDFSELENSDLIGGKKGSTPFTNSSGKTYLRFDHGNSETYSITTENNRVYAELNYNGSSNAGLYVPFLKNAGESLTLNVKARYESKAPSEIEAITLCGARSGDFLNLVKLSPNGSIMYREGKGYKDTGVDLTEYQWKDIAVSLNVKSGKITADYYVSGVMRAENISVDSSFTQFVGLKVFPASENKTADIDVDDVFAYNAEAPLYGKAPTASSDSINASLNIDGIESEKTFFDNYRGDGIVLSSNGNPMQVMTSGANKYLAVSCGEYSSYADMISKKENKGISQVIEIAIKRDKNYSSETEILSPYYEDSSGIVHRIGILTLKENGNVILTKTGDLVGNISDSDYTVISVVLTFDRAYADVYIDGELMVTGVKYTERTYSEIDGVRIVRTSENGAGSLFVDYAVMYSGIVPSYLADGTELCYENGFESANIADIAPLKINGSGIERVKFGTGYGLGYVSEGVAELRYELKASDIPLYTEFEFMFNKIGDGAELMSLKNKNGADYIALGIEKDGTLYSYSDGEKVTGKKLVAGKEYQITVYIDPANKVCSVYADGKTVFSYGFIDIPTDFKELSFIKSRRGGSIMSIDRLMIYRSYRKLGSPLEGQDLSFELSTGWDGGVEMKWDGIGKGAKYTVWKSASASSEQIKICDLTSETEFYDADVEEDKTYFYAVYQTVIRGDEEICIGFGGNIKAVTVTLPDESQKPTLPSGALPSFKSTLELDEDFSDSETELIFNTERCFIEESSKSLRIINDADSKEIPYFALNVSSPKKAAIFDFSFNITKSEGKIVLAGIYGEKGKVSTIATFEEEKLIVNDQEIMTLNCGKTYRMTLWIDIGCDRAALFIDGKCVAMGANIPLFAGKDEGYTVRFCQAMDETLMSMDDFKLYRTRSFVSDYMKNISVIATASGSSNRISWTEITGVSGYTVWASNEENSGYTALTEKLEKVSLVEENIQNTRYYRVNYSFDLLGPELIVPMSDVGICYRSAGSQSGETEVPPFIDFSSPAAVMVMIVLFAGVAALVIAFVTSKRGSGGDETD